MADDLLDRMRSNPAGDWTIGDIERLCRAHGINCKPPSGGGAHYKIAHAEIADILTIPARRPIKPKYIRLLVRFVGLVITLGVRREP
ncbi:MAG: type II toxin-antitoxin system HicA family toxin [Bosea sp. (in: a-proteobacteria)]|uniref:type II toxin-antitoxin system HicA family toxin n=1 Tax=Bosea sp. (in: a-proteobacteria) TaxID=1871050 RepID=UPI002737300E|nr:type II toxin-antitoxin system HicA family toxin [Bosea sp. (in: a-proteobacteria)]MDP3257701.1 type II toxin-antitoxin system HicA family toxin [Bosea sp. (in: a-proteobacteria)]MDP3321544.1 type II toxin-antitoxin system HicA family toxin [Bosea sp. (in: a-proteobacteria)]